MLRNTETHWGALSRFLHWFIALLVIIMLVLGVTIHEISDKALRGQVIFYHKSIGVLILVLMLLRLIWRLCNKTPRLPTSIPSWQKILSRISHGLIYLAVIVMAASGLLMSAAGGYTTKFFGWFTVAIPIAKNKALAGIFSDVHLVLAWTIGALLIIHILAALKHHFIDKDHVVKRMVSSNHRELQS